MTTISNSPAGALPAGIGPSGQPAPPSAAETSSGAAASSTSWDDTIVGSEDYGYVPVRPAVRMEDLDDKAVTMSSSDGRLTLRFEDGGDDGLKVTATVDGQQLEPRFLGEGEYSFVMDGRQVTLDVDNYETGTLHQIKGIGKDHHDVRIAVTELGNAGTTADDSIVAEAGVHDGQTSTASNVMSDDQLAGFIQQLTGQDVRGAAQTRLIDGPIVPPDDVEQRNATSAFLGDFGTGYIEFGPNIAEGDSWPAINMRIATKDEHGNDAVYRFGGLLSSPTGSVSIHQENGLETSFSWRFHEEGDHFVLDGVDVRSTGTDRATGQQVDRAFTIAPSGDEFQAAFAELGFTQDDYLSLFHAFNDDPGFQKFSTR
jgi:hypothetical protein